MRREWGKGYMRDALQALLGFCFEELHLQRIEADVDPRNERSAKLLQGLGFQQEGVLRERWRATGEVQDSVIYGLLRREWKGAENSYRVHWPSDNALVESRRRPFPIRLLYQVAKKPLSAVGALITGGWRFIVGIFS